MSFRTKAVLASILFSFAPQAFAFNQLVCQGDLDVRLNPSGKKAPSKSFAITKKEALELELTINGLAIGEIYPWARVTWQPAKASTDLKDVKFKTDDSTVFEVSLVTAKDSKPHELHCAFRLN